MTTDSPLAQTGEFIKLGTEAVSLLRALYPLLPTQKKDEIEAKVHAVEEALQTANVSLAKQWGYKLCQCTFPPQIMLWREPEKSHVCGSCGHRISRFKQATKTPTLRMPQGPWTRSRGGFDPEEG